MNILASIDEATTDEDYVHQSAARIMQHGEWQSREMIILGDKRRRLERNELDSKPPASSSHQQQTLRPRPPDASEDENQQADADGQPASYPAPRTPQIGSTQLDTMSPYADSGYGSVELEFRRTGRSPPAVIDGDDYPDSHRSRGGYRGQYGRVVTTKAIDSGMKRLESI